MHGMHSLRHTYRRALQGTASIQKTRVGSERAYNTESTPHADLRKSKEERFKLVMQFVVKYKASNNGKLPGISVLRKEVGGKYEILKEILHDINTEEAEMEMPAGGTKGSPQVLDYSWKRQPLPAEVLEKEKKLVSSMEKTTEIKKDNNLADSRTAAKAMKQTEESMTSGKDDSQPIMDISSGIDEDDNAPLGQMENSSKLASKRMDLLPEFCLLITRVPAFTTCADLRAAFKDCGEIFNASVSLNKNMFWIKGHEICAAVNFKTEEGLKAAMMKEKVLLRGQLIDLKLDWNGTTATKLMTCEVKQAKAQYRASKTEGQQNGLDIVNDVNSEPARHLHVDGDFGLQGKASPSRRHSQHTTAVRIANLPLHVTESKLKSLCESIASVYRLDLRRGQIADVHFNVKETKDRNHILRRLRKVAVGDCRLKVFPILYYGNDTNKPQDVNHLKEVRGNILNYFERTFQQLCFQFQDYRELLAMKWAVQQENNQNVRT